MPGATGSARREAQRQRSTEEAVHDADDFDPVVHRGFGYAADDRIEPGTIAAGRQNADSAIRFTGHSTIT